MKWKTLVGALVVGVGLCSQSFGFDLLDRRLGHHGCGSCCETNCCEAQPTCCEAAPACNSCSSCGESSCGCESSCGHGCHRIDLFAGLRGLFECHHHHGCCEETSCCEAAPACDTCN